MTSVKTVDEWRSEVTLLREECDRALVVHARRQRSLRLAQRTYEHADREAQDQESVLGDLRSRLRAAEHGLARAVLAVEPWTGEQTVFVGPRGASIRFSEEDE